MNPRIALALVLLAAVPAQAAVYKCTNAAGTVEFKDKPCAPGSGGEIAVKGMEPARAGGGDSNGSGKVLKGRWCEFAVSLELDGERDETTQAQWNFLDDSVQYQVKGMLAPQSAKLELHEDGFSVHNGLFGGRDAVWRVVQQRGDSATVQSPIIGYYHMRRGSCS